MDSAEIIKGVSVVVGVIVSLSFHEWAHAFVADRRGDPTARELGRLTINPIRHIDPFLTIMLPAFLWFVLPMLTGAPPLAFGGAKPVPVAPGNLRQRHRDMALVAAAGPAINLVIAFGLLSLHEGLRTWGGVHSSHLGLEVVRLLAVLNVLFTVFNLLPIPPLDGSRIVAYLLPRQLQRPFQALDRIGLLLVVAFVFLIPGTGKWIMDAVMGTYDWVAGVVMSVFDVIAPDKK